MSRYAKRRLASAARPILCHTEPPARVQPSCPLPAKDPTASCSPVVVEVAVAVATGAMALAAAMVRLHECLQSVPRPHPGIASPFAA